MGRRARWLALMTADIREQGLASATNESFVILKQDQRCMRVIFMFLVDFCKWLTMKNAALQVHHLTSTDRY